MLNFESLIKPHLEALPQQLTESLKCQFHKDQVVRLNHLVPVEISNSLNAEAAKLIDNEGKRRELMMTVTGDTPRAYTSVDRDEIYALNGNIRKFFENGHIRNYLSIIADEPLNRVPYAREEYIVNSQKQIGDTHGWHFDDYSYALIWVAEAPDPLDGGRIEYVNFSEWDKAAPKEQLIELLTKRETRSMFVPEGSCYLMKARYVLHRVAPLISGKKRRTVIVFTYASDADMNDRTISHETMEAIYEVDPETSVV